MSSTKINNKEKRTQDIKIRHNHSNRICKRRLNQGNCTKYSHLDIANLFLSHFDNYNIIKIFIYCHLQVIYKNIWVDTIKIELFHTIDT